MCRWIFLDNCFMLFVILHPGQWHILAGVERWQVADLRFLAQVWGCCLDTSSRAGSTSSTRSGRTTSCWTSGGPGQTATTWPGRGFTKCSKNLSILTINRISSLFLPSHFAHLNASYYLWTQDSAGICKPATRTVRLHHQRWSNFHYSIKDFYLTIKW